MIKVKNNERNNYKGFTLAEVLITLGIIGVVAAMTIPTLLQNQQEKATVTALKKFYSTASSAYSQAVKDNGTPDSWGLTANVAGSVKFISIIEPYLKITKKCVSGDYKGCVYKSYYKMLAGTNYAIYDTLQLGKGILSDGSSFIVEIQSPTCSVNRGDLSLSNICGSIFVDVNGFKNPNQLGVDFYRFYITKNGIMPGGLPEETSYPFDPDCKNLLEGFGCAAWVLYNENLDYLKCNDLSWDGKKQCD